MVLKGLLDVSTIRFEWFNIYGKSLTILTVFIIEVGHEL